MLEFNENINVEKLINKPESEGYLAILMCKDPHNWTTDMILSNIFKHSTNLY